MLSRRSQEWRVVRRPIPTAQAAFLEIAPQQVVQMITCLAETDPGDPSVVPPFDSNTQFTARQLVEATAGLSPAELLLPTKTIADARALCFRCQETLRRKSSSPLFERLSSFDNERYPLLAGPMRASEERAWFDLFRQLDERRQGHVTTGDLRTWVGRRSDAVVDSVLLEYVLQLVPTERPGAAKLEEMVQNVEWLAVLTSDGLADFAFDSLAVLSGSLAKEHIIVDGLARQNHFFLRNREREEDVAKTHWTNLSLNDKLLMNLRAAADRHGLVGRSSFRECCSTHVQVLFPLKYVQTSLYSVNKSIGSILANRRVAVQSKRNAHEFLQTFKATSALVRSQASQYSVPSGSLVESFRYTQERHPESSSGKSKSKKGKFGLVEPASAPARVVSALMPPAPAATATQTIATQDPGHVARHRATLKMMKKDAKETNKIAYELSKGKLGQRHSSMLIRADSFFGKLPGFKGQPELRKAKPQPDVTSNLAR